MKQKTVASPELDSKIIAFYATDKTTWQCATEFGCAQSFIICRLKANGIERRPNHYYTRKYPVNEDFFETIDSEEKAYFLGFLFADGNNYVREGRNYVISMGLQWGDRIILEKLRDLISPLSEIEFVPVSQKHPTRKDQGRLTIDSKKMSQQLTALGCVPAKSLTLKYPEWLQDAKLTQHFLRGHFDGDGSLCAERPKRRGYVDYKWSIISSIWFIDGAEQQIKKQVDVHFNREIRENQITTTIKTGGNRQVLRLMEWLYDGATIFLPRKHDLYLELKKHCDDMVEKGTARGVGAKSPMIS
jgi:hypothetical protein